MTLWRLKVNEAHLMTDHHNELSQINHHLETEATRLEEEFTALLHHTGEHGDLHSVCNKLLDDFAKGKTSPSRLYLESLPQTTNHKKLFGVLVQLTASDLMSLLKTLDQNSTVEAIKHLSQAQHNLGRLNGAFDGGLYRRKNMTGSATRRHAPNDRIGNTKKKILALLEHSVAQGKKTKTLSETFELLKNDLTKFFDEQKTTPPKLEEMQRTVSRWKKTDSEFRYQFDQLIEKLRG